MYRSWLRLNDIYLVFLCNQESNDKSNRAGFRFQFVRSVRLIFEFDGVYINGIDGTAFVIATLLFRFFVSELFAARMFQHIIRFFTKRSSCSFLKNANQILF